MEIIVMDTSRIIEEEVRQFCKQKLDGIISEFKGMLDILKRVNSYHKVKKLIEGHPYFVKPNRIVLG